MSPIGECGYRRRDSCLRRNGNAFLPKAKKHSHERPPPLFHSGESRNLILATARIFREAEHCNCRLSANAASPQRFRLSPEWKCGRIFFYPPPPAGGGKNSQSEFLGGGESPTNPKQKNHPQARRAKNSASINTGLPVARFPGVHAVPAISKCAHAGQSEKCERNAAAVIAPPGRPPIFAKSA